MSTRSRCNSGTNGHRMIRFGHDGRTLKVTSRSPISQEDEMAEHANVELLRNGYAAYGSGDMDTITALFADDIVWHIAGRSQVSGDYKGRDQVFGFFGKLMELSDGTSKIEVHDILANDDHGVAIGTGTGTRNGKCYSGQEVHTFHIRNGQVVEFWDSPLDQYEADEFWA